MINTKLNLLSSGTIDLYDNVGMSLNFSIADVRNIDKRNGSFSKTITLPGTKNNNKLFGHLFNIGVSGSYNANIKAPVDLTIDEVTLFRGNLQLNKIINSVEEKKEYEVTIFGNVAGIFDSIGEGKLSDLDLSAYDHAYTSTNQQNSWASSIKKNGAAYAFTLGEGYVYPLIDYGLDSTHSAWRVTEMYPSIYVKQYLDKIFEAAGYTYSSAFFDSSFFKHLVIPFSSESFKLTDASVLSRRVRASRTSAATYTLTGPYVYNDPVKSRIGFTDDTTTPNGDLSNQWATSGGIIANSGYYDFSTSGAIQFTLPANYSTFDEINVALKITRANPASFGGISQVWGNSSGIQLDHFVHDPVPKTIPFVFSDAISNLYCEAGDVFEVYVMFRPTDPANGADPYGGIGASSIALTINSGAFLRMETANRQMVEGSTVALSSAIPVDVLQKDFVTSIVKLFNLYIEVDRTNSKKLYVEPRNDFYAAGETLDWSSKLDKDRNMEVTPMGSLDAKSLLFQYTDDVDHWNKGYKDKYGYNYGRRKVDVTSDFVNGEKKTDVIFAPTPGVSFLNSDRVTPAMYTIAGGVHSQLKKGKIRILYYGGLKPCNQQWRLTNSNGSSWIPFSTYPYAGMVDDPYAPTLDLGFGVPKELFWTTLTYTNNNLYNKYYKQFIDEIIEQDSRLITGYFRLTYADILALDFRNTIHIEGINYRLNAVLDYNPIVEGMTKVELLKVTNQVSFEAKTVVVDGAAATPINTGLVANDLDSEIIPTRSLEGYDLSDGNNYSPQSGQRVSGQNNFISPSASFVEAIGSFNYVGANTRYIGIYNSSGVIINEGVKNVTVSDSSGVTVSQSNVRVVNNVYFKNGLQSSGGILTFVGLISQASTNAPTITVLENSLGQALQLSYSSVGTYRLSVTAEIFDSLKTTVEISGNETACSIQAQVNEFNEIFIVTKTFLLVTANDLLTNATITIKVYP